jgi:LysR family transcriptional regulator, transcription activator of glutamate synthase operon
MEIRQLAYVEAVARHRHFTRAAEELHVAQPALSQQIRKLEAELGTALFERTSRRVLPTEAGEAVAARARRVLAEVEGARSEVEGLRGLIRGRVSIGALLPAGEIYVPELLVSFGAEFPGVDVTLFAGTAGDLLEHLARDEVDVAFLLVAGEMPPRIETLPLSSEELVAVFPPTAAPSAKSVGPETLAGGAPLVTPRSGSAIKNALDAYLERAGLDARVSLESGDPFLLRCLVSEGFGTAVLPRSLTAMPGPAVEVRALRPSIRLPVVLGWRQDRHLPPPATAFVDFVRRRAGGE